LYSLYVWHLQCCSQLTTTATTIQHQQAVGDTTAVPPVMKLVPISLRYSMSILPAIPMIPRIADERVGYFTTTYTDVGDHRAADTAKRTSAMLDPAVVMINRRRMTPDSVKHSPLVYYIDPSVPQKWRAALKRGVENWQSAFEAIGYGSKAIIAVLPGDKQWSNQYDAADIRFNSITWSVDLEETFALGPSTIDPRTGEILRSNIVFTSGWLLSWLQSFEALGSTTAATKPTRRNTATAASTTTAAAKVADSIDSVEAVSSSSRANRQLREWLQAHEYSSSKHQHATVGTDYTTDTLATVMPSILSKHSTYKKSARHHDRHTCQHTRLHGSHTVDNEHMSHTHTHSHTSSSSSGTTASTKHSLLQLHRSLADSTDWDTVIAQGLTDVVMHEVG
jgi:Domain of unknown function (DUF5117)